MIQLSTGPEYRTNKKVKEDAISRRVYVKFLIEEQYALTSNQIYSCASTCFLVFQQNLCTRLPLMQGLKRVNVCKLIPRNKEVFSYNLNQVFYVTGAILLL